MKDKICATIDKNHLYVCTSKTIGRQGENLCMQLELTLEDCLCDSWVYLVFKKADGTTKITERLEIVNNVVTYDIGNDLIDVDGELSVFVELHNEDGLVWKSSTKTYTVLQSFDGTEQIENKEDFITEAQKTLDHLNSLERGLQGEKGFSPIAKVEQNENGASIVITDETGTTSAKILNGEKGERGEKGEKGDKGEQGIQGEAGIVDYSKVANALINEKSGSIVAFDGVNPVYNQLNVTSTIEAVQEGTGDPSPENIRPIVGWDSASVTRTGKNFIKLANTEKTSHNVSITVKDGVITMDGESTTTLTVSITLGKFRLKAGQYMFSYEKNGENISGVEDNASILSIKSTTGTVAQYRLRYKTSLTQSITVEKDEEYVIGLFLAPSPAKYNNFVIKPQLELSETTTEYEPYQEQKITTELPETVYGGSIDWNTGILTVTHKKVELDGINENRKAKSKNKQNTRTNAYVVPTDDWDRLVGKNVQLKVSHYEYLGTTAGSSGLVRQSVMMCDVPGSMYIGDDTITTLEEYNEFLKTQYDNGTPVTIVYELATPYTIQLTPQQLEGLQGTNTIFSENGDVTIIYNRDINKAFVELQQAIISLGGNI